MKCLRLSSAVVVGACSWILVSQLSLADDPRTAVQSLPGGADAQFVISSPGSYYLSNNITGVAGKSGIRVASDSVIIDLNGFALLGVPGSDDGITTEGGTTLYNGAVLNGSAQGWGRDGLNMGNQRNARVVGVHASDNGRGGITTSSDCTLSQCTAAHNNSYGISVYQSCTIKGCTAFENGAGGMQASDSSVFVGCSSVNNEGDGLKVISGAGTFEDCTVQANHGNGIVLFNNSTGRGGSVANCTATENFGSGISAQGASKGVTISRCTVSSNGVDGIRVGANSSVQDNTANFNKGSGVRASGSDNRIDGNNATRNHKGIDTDSGGNLIVRNSASGNVVNYEFTGVNTFGPTNVLTGQISDNNPWRNFNY